MLHTQQYTYSPEKYGNFGIGAVSPRVSLGNPAQNVSNILEALGNPQLRQCRFIVLPELSITGYTCADLFLQDSLIEAAAEALLTLAHELKSDTRLIAVGAPLLKGHKLYNCAVVICKGEILGAVPKSFIPNYQEFYERRWFAPGRDVEGETVSICGITVPFGKDLIFEYQGVKVGVEICEDLWMPVPPSSGLCMAGAEVVLNLSATDDNVGKFDYIRSLVKAQSGRCRCAYAYSAAGSGESSTDLVFSGIDLVACNGLMLSQSERFTTDIPLACATVDIEKIRNERRKYSTFGEGHSEGVYRLIDIPDDDRHLFPAISVEPYPFIPSSNFARTENCKEIIEIQSWGLAQRLKATGCKNLVVGISGGLDSTLALLTVHNTFRKLGLDPRGIVGVTMPSTATSQRTHSNAHTIMQALGVTILEIPINDAVQLHFRDIGHEEGTFDAVYENSQARERTQILMDLANKYGGMVLGTGDMSEMALGWCTYNGDHMSMYNVNAGVPKTLVKYLVGWYAENSDSEKLRLSLLDIIDTPISPELIPSAEGEEIGQKTEELVGPYELHDFFLFHVLRNGFRPSKIQWMAELAFEGKYDRETIKKWLVNFYRRFFTQQFKRSCMPDGPKVGSVCLSPRGDWRMPSDASARLWLKEAESL
ncbi:MAG: NAD(+) synthase [Muribaculaceae bacterium]|nr:NAD(+) synthase [Muribaculaceae bacterium]